MNLEAISPGADDNASGIAVITEVLRVLMLTIIVLQELLCLWHMQQRR